MCYQNKSVYDCSDPPTGGYGGQGRRHEWSSGPPRPCRGRQALQACTDIGGITTYVGSYCLICVGRAQDAGVALPLILPEAPPPGAVMGTERPIVQYTPGYGPTRDFPRSKGHGSGRPMNYAPAPPVAAGVPNFSGPAMRLPLAPSQLQGTNHAAPPVAAGAPNFSGSAQRLPLAPYQLQGTNPAAPTMQPAVGPPPGPQRTSRTHRTRTAPYPPPQQRQTPPPPPRQSTPRPTTPRPATPLRTTTLNPSSPYNPAARRSPIAVSASNSPARRSSRTFTPLRQSTLSPNPLRFSQSPRPFFGQVIPTAPIPGESVMDYQLRMESTDGAPKDFGVNRARWETAQTGR